MTSFDPQPSKTDYKVPHLKQQELLDIDGQGSKALVSDDARCPYCRSRVIVPNSGRLLNPQEPQGPRLYRCAGCMRIYGSTAHLRSGSLRSADWIMMSVLVLVLLGCGWLWFG